MNTARRLAALFFVGSFSTLSLLAQAEYPFSFRGTSYQTNAAGKIVASRITDQTMLQEIAQSAGISDLSSLALVYHENGNAVGDTVDVINPANGQVLDTIFGFYFGESFGRMALANSSGAVVRRIDYLYTKQNDHSLGTAFVVKSSLPDRKGNVRRAIQGQMKYLVTPEGSAPLKVCTGSFTTGPELIFTNAP